MIRKIYLAILTILLLLPTLSDAYHYSGSYSHSSHYSSGSTHWVRPYTNRYGVYHQGHLSGNPGSGVHCHDNACY